MTFDSRIPMESVRFVLRGASFGLNTGGPEAAWTVEDIAAVVMSLRDIATNAWKARVRIEKLQAGDGGADADRVARHLEGILEGLAAAGVEIKDHTGEAFDYGQPLKVVASQERDGIDREVVAETIRPSLYLKGQIIQQGEVIIDVPAAKHGE